jgi:predicted kinase
MSKDLILLRGVPGSGKSTLAEVIGGVVFEADMYFVAPDGSYQFDPTRIKDAHNWCRHKVMETMKSGEPKVIVSNTFTQEWEMESYYILADELGYRVFSIIAENRHGGSNQHGVPAEKIQQMRDRFQIKL